MSILPTDDAIARFKANEERVDIFVNDPLSTGYYTTNETVPRQVKTLPELADGIVESASLRADLVSNTAGKGAALVAFTGPDGNPYTVADIASSTTGKGDALIATKQPFTGSVARTQHDKNQEWVSVLDFGADPTGMTPCSDKIQNAVDNCLNVFIPRGTYLVNSPVTLRNGSRLLGEGIELTILKKETDIEVFNSNSSQAVFGIVIEKLDIQSTVSTATTKYDLHFTNPHNCTIVDTRVKSGHGDSDYSNTNVGGIFFDNSLGGTSFMNLVENCWVQNNSVYFKNITDSVIRGGYLWGHTREFAVRFAGGGANSVEHVAGIICSKYKGGIWLDGSGINQIRITNNEFDGNPLLDTGTGVYCPQCSYATLISNNTFWGCDFHGIDTVDPVGWSITGNTFWKNNAADNGYDDIRITGKTFSPNSNVISGNAHVIDDARTNKGYAINEVNDGFNPVSNVYSSNGISGNYLSPTIHVLTGAKMSCNKGAGITTDEFSGGTKRITKTASLALNGYIDIVLSGTAYLGSLYVSTVRSEYPVQSRRAVYTIAHNDNAGQYTQLSILDGSGGGTTFTITFPSSGVIRVTNTFADATNVNMILTFDGVEG